jgi:hypothetical protein
MYGSAIDVLSKVATAPMLLILNQSASPFHDSRRSHGQQAAPLKMFHRLLCRRRRKWPSSRLRFLPHESDLIAISVAWIG